MTALLDMETLLTAKDVAAYLRVSLALAYKMAERGQIPCIRWECPGAGKEKPRTVVRFKAEDVKEFADQHYTKP